MICSYLEFQGLTPNKLSWNPSALADNPPRLIRYQRLGAILAEFGIKTDLASFDKGKFINEKDPAYEALLSRASTSLPDATGTPLAIASKSISTGCDDFRWGATSDSLG